MAVTLTEFRRYRIGNRKGVRGRFTAGGTGTDDIVTGLKRVEWASLQGVQTSDNQVQIARNTLTTTDMAGDAPGTIHCTGVAASATTYMFVAEGV